MLVAQGLWVLFSQENTAFRLLAWKQKELPNVCSFFIFQSDGGGAFKGFKGLVASSGGGGFSGFGQSISTPRRESGSLCPYVRCVALHTEVSLYEPRMFLRLEIH